MLATSVDLWTLTITDMNGWVDVMTADFNSLSVEFVRELFVFESPGGALKALGLHSAKISIFDIDPIAYAVPFPPGFDLGTNDHRLSMPRIPIINMMEEDLDISLRDFIARFNSTFQDNVKASLLAKHTFNLLSMRPVTHLCDNSALEQFDPRLFVTRANIHNALKYWLNQLYAKWPHGTNKIISENILYSFMHVLIENINGDKKWLTSLSENDIVTATLEMAQKNAEMTKPKFYESYNQVHRANLERSLARSSVLERIDPNSVNEMYKRIVTA